MFHTCSIGRWTNMQLPNCPSKEWPAEGTQRNILQHRFNNLAPQTVYTYIRDSFSSLIVREYAPSVLHIKSIYLVYETDHVSRGRATSTTFASVFVHRPIHSRVSALRVRMEQRNSSAWQICCQSSSLRNSILLRERAT